VVWRVLARATRSLSSVRASSALGTSPWRTRRGAARGLACAVAVLALRRAAAPTEGLAAESLAMAIRCPLAERGIIDTTAARRIDACQDLAVRGVVRR